MSNVTYPLDTTGISPGNLVRDEPHVLTEINDATYRIIIPDFAPFYQDNFELKYLDGNGTTVTLVKGVDFDFCLPYMDASRAIGKYLFGAITIHNVYVQGFLAVTYQTLGDKWVADKNFVLEALVEHNYNPRVVYWDQVTNTQQLFPPTSHAQDYDTIYGQKSVIEAFDRLIEAILQGPNPGNEFLAHVISTGNPHKTTYADIGLPDLFGAEPATLTEMANSEPLEKLFSLKNLIESGIIPNEAGISEIKIQLDAIKDGARTDLQSEIDRVIAELTEAYTQAIDDAKVYSVEKAKLDTLEIVRPEIELAKNQAIAEAADEILPIVAGDIAIAKNEITAATTRDIYAAKMEAINTSSVQITNTNAETLRVLRGEIADTKVQTLIEAEDRAVQLITEAMDASNSQNSQTVADAIEAAKLEAITTAKTETLAIIRPEIAAEKAEVLDILNTVVEAAKLEVITDLTTDIEVAKNEAIQESVTQAAAMIQSNNNSNSSGGRPELLTASQYYMSALFG